MTNVNPDQTHLDNDTAGEVIAEGTLVVNFATILADLKAQPGSAALDFTNADNFLAKITADASATTSELPGATVPPVSSSTSTSSPATPPASTPPA